MGPDVVSLYIPVEALQPPEPHAEGRGDPENRGDSYGRDALAAGPGERGQSRLPGSETGLSWRRPDGKHTP